MKSSSPRYPIATVIAYGPDDKTATKLVAAIFNQPGQKEPAAIEKWIVLGGDIRQDPAITAEVMAFIKQHGARQTGTFDRIFGCPHEEGIDYPEGGTCPHCPFWEKVDRYTGRPKTSAPGIGRNDPCPCGSGKKYKKCCGR